jgi:hypothetical protein
MVCYKKIILIYNLTYFPPDTFYDTSSLFNGINLASNNFSSVSSSATSIDPQLEGAEFEALTACPSPENQVNNIFFITLNCLRYEFIYFSFSRALSATCSSFALPISCMALAPLHSTPLASPTLMKMYLPNI